MEHVLFLKPEIQHLRETSQDFPLLGLQEKGAMWQVMLTVTRSGKDALTINKQGLQSYNHKELNLVSNLNEPILFQSPQMKIELANTLL